MTKKHYILWIAMLILFSPSYAFAQSSYQVGFDTASSLGFSVDANIQANINFDVSVQANANARASAYIESSRRVSSSHVRSRRVYHHDNNIYYAPQAEVHYQAAPEVYYQPAPIEVYYQPAPVEVRYQPAPVEVRYQPAPVEVRYQPAPVEVRYQPAPVEVRYQPAPVEVRYQTAPVEVRYQTAPVMIEQAPCGHCMVQPSETYAVESAGFYVDEESRNSEITLGLRGIGFYGNHLQSLCGDTDIDPSISGGLGLYTRFRPIRWLAFEFISDIAYGKDRDANAYFRIPLSFGLQFHAFNYGIFNLYGVAAASITFVYTDSHGVKDEYQQYGGQFGGGLSVVLGMVELGLDARYTIDTPPDSFDTAFGKFVPQKNFQHGVLFAANIGLAF